MMVSADKSSNKALSILAVDDDQFMTNLIRLYGEKLGCEVYELNESRNIGKALLAHEIDVIFLDLTMPGKDGVEVLQELQKFECKAAIVLMSGLKARRIESVASLVQNSKLEFIGSISKPFSFPQVSGMLEEVIDFKVTNRPQDAASRNDQILRTGPQLLFEPEIILDDTDDNSASDFNVHLVWIDDEYVPVKFQSLKPKKSPARSYLNSQNAVNLQGLEGLISVRRCDSLTLWILVIRQRHDMSFENSSIVSLSNSPPTYAVAMVGTTPDS